MRQPAKTGGLMSALPIYWAPEVICDRGGDSRLRGWQSRVWQSCRDRGNASRNAVMLPTSAPTVLPFQTTLAVGR